MQSHIAPFIWRSSPHQLNSGTKEPLFVTRSWSTPWPPGYTRVLARPWSCGHLPSQQVPWLEWICHAGHWLTMWLASLCLLCSTVIVFYVQTGPPFKVLKAAEVARNLHRRLSEEKADFLLFKVLRIDTAGMPPIRNIFIFRGQVM